MSKQRPDLALIPSKRKPGDPPCETSSDCSIPMLNEQGEVIGFRARLSPYLYAVGSSARASRRYRMIHA